MMGVEDMRITNNNCRMVIFVLVLLALAGGCQQQRLGPPPATRVETVVDTLHGVEVEDPYRWLEDGASDEVAAWTAAQNNYFREYIDGFEGHDRVVAEVERLLTIGHITSPEVRGNHYFFYRREAGQNHMVLYKRTGLEGTPEVLVDPNSFSEDGTVAMDWAYLSPDGSILAYGKSSSGNEQSTLFLINTEDCAHLSDTIPYTSSVSLAWLPDNSGFYYTRTPVPGAVPEGEEGFHRRVYFHKVGSGWQDDPVIFGEGYIPTAWPFCAVSPNGRWLVCGVYLGYQQTELFVKDLSQRGSRFDPIVTGVEAIFNVTPLNDRFLIQTNYLAPNNRLMIGRYDRPGMKFWQEIIPERDFKLEEFYAIGGHIVARSLRNAASLLELYDLRGDLMREFELPTLGTVSGVTGEWGGDEMFCEFSSFTYPPTIMRYGFADETFEIVDGVETDLNLDDFTVKQVWYNSEDGTPVSMFVVHRKDIVLDGQNPTYLYGYGGFDVSMVPSFSRTRTFWLNQGGVYALANVRGGGEYGKEWHEGGILEKKQNSFDDFIAAAEYLIDEGYTSSDKLVISGGSGGGLLVGAVLVQRPELFKAVVCSVPLLDMLRYHKFLLGRLWIPEYGSADDSDQFDFIYDYSPYQNVYAGVAFPAVYLSAAESDARVDPLHARKMAARLQAATISDNPVLLRIETKAGHGQGKPMSKIAIEIAEEWTFVMRALGMTF